MITKNTIKTIQSLKQAKYRKEYRLFIVEGKKSVEELLGSTFEVQALYATEQFLEEHDFHDERLEPVSEVQMEQMSTLDTPPGILAVVRIPEQNINQDEGMVLALDGIANPGNLGTIIRTAEWFGIRHIICSEDSVELWNPKVIQATMGSVFRMSITYTPLEPYLETARSNGRPIYGALLKGENIFQKKQWDEGIIVIGSESHGIRPSVLPLITHPITIPRAAGSVTESLNASMAAGIILASFAMHL